MLNVGDQVIVTHCPEPFLGFVVNTLCENPEVGFTMFSEFENKWVWISIPYKENTLIKTGFRNISKALEVRRNVDLELDK